MHWGYDGMGWAMGWGGLLWILVIAGVIWLLTRRTGGRTAGQEDSPEVILKRRYARGEMNREEYDQRLNDLRK